MDKPGQSVRKLKKTKQKYLSTVLYSKRLHISEKIATHNMVVYENDHAQETWALGLQDAKVKL